MIVPEIEEWVTFVRKYNRPGKVIDIRHGSSEIAVKILPEFDDEIISIEENIVSMTIIKEVIVNQKELWLLEKQLISAERRVLA